MLEPTNRKLYCTKVECVSNYPIIRNRTVVDHDMHYTLVKLEYQLETAAARVVVPPPQVEKVGVNS